MLPGQGMQHRILNTEIDDNDDTRRRMFHYAKANSATREGERIFVKNPPSSLDNRYTDVVSLLCKVHESTTTTNSLLTIKTDKTVWQEM